MKNVEENPDASITNADDIFMLNTTQDLNNKETYTPIQLLPKVSITFLPLNALQSDLKNKSKYQHFFHLVWFAQILTKKHLNKDITNLVANNGLILVENELYFVNMDKNHSNDYHNFLNTVFDSSTCNYYKTFDHKKDTHATFIVKRLRE